MKKIFWFACFSLIVSHAQNIVLTFPQSLAYANNTNPFIKPSYLQLAIADLEYQRSKVRSNPVLNMQLLSLMDHSIYPEKPLVLSRTNRQDWFQLTKKLQSWGQRKNTISLAKQNHTLEYHTYSKTLFEYKYETSLKWLDAWHAQMSMQLAYTAARSLDTLIAKSAKDSSTLTYLRYTLLDDQYDMNYTDAQNEYNTKINDLKLHIGALNKPQLDTTGFFYKPLPPLDSMIDYALSHHPQVIEKQQELSIDRHNLKLQKSLSIPSPEVGIIQNPQNTIPYTGVFFTQPIPLFDANRKNIGIAKVQLDQSTLEQEALKLKLKHEIQVKYASLTAQIKKKIQITKAELDADRLLLMVRDASSRKKDSPVDMWEAETTWFEVQQLYYQTDYELRRAYIELLYTSALLE